LTWNLGDAKTVPGAGNAFCCARVKFKKYKPIVMQFKDNHPYLDRPLYNTKDLMEFFGMSRASLWRIQKTGFLERLPIGKVNRVPRAEVVRYLESVSAQKSE
tara:strand:+ start:1143 stop:1448 length:306 start_codon:yes stop_codon:yes gene_type:complete